MKNKIILLLFLATACQDGVFAEKVSPYPKIVENIKITSDLTIFKNKKNSYSFKKFFKQEIIFEKTNDPNEFRRNFIMPLIEKGYCPVASVVFDHEDQIKTYGNQRFFKHELRALLTDEELEKIAKQIGSEIVVGSYYFMDGGKRWNLKMQQVGDINNDKFKIFFELDSVRAYPATRYEFFFLNKKENISGKTNCLLNY